MKGMRFGRLTVIDFAYNQGNGGHAYWNALCKCGKKITVRGSHLRTKETKSCGCISAEKGRKFLKKYAKSSSHKGEGNPMWKGDEAKHAAIHVWLAKNKIKKKCEFCNSIKFIDYALIRGLKHSHNINNYMTLCRSCHMKYDRQK